MTSLRSVLVFSIAAALAGCAGMHGSSPPLPSSSQISSNQIPVGVRGSNLTAAGTLGTLTFQITIPTYGTSGSYVSPATKGMNFDYCCTTYGRRVFNLTRTSSKCVQGTTRVCTLNVSLSAGNYGVTLYLYDEAPVSGQIPSTAKMLSTEPNAPVTITSGQTTTFVPTLRGVPASLSVGPMPAAGCTAIPATSFPVAAFDADGHKIVGAYANPYVMLSDSDSSGATTIATKGKDNPPADTLLSSSDKATIAWNGYGIPGNSATIIAASGGSVPDASAAFTPQATSGSTTFYLTYGEQVFTVPACATTVFVTAAGAQGGSVLGSNGGLGGSAMATIATTPGESLVVVVGGAALGETANQGGFNGGGDGYPCTSCYHQGAGGGGGTDIRQGGDSLYNRVVVGAGGGGAGTSSAGGANGGAGGGLTGGSGNGAGCPVGAAGGGGGTQTSGGVGPGGTASDGSFGVGGPGDSYCFYGGEDTSGGGGGGWYGGGGGWNSGGGGGGSSYAESSATNVQLSTGVQSGSGYAKICWGYSNQMCGSGNAAKKPILPARRH
jgi:hypothetical protein